MILTPISGNREWGTETAKGKAASIGVVSAQIEVIHNFQTQDVQSQFPRSFLPCRNIPGLNGVSATASPNEAGTAHTGQPLNDSFWTSSVRFT
jgi:hypothetical protein